MNPEQLEQFILKSDIKAIVEAVSNLTEPERKKLSAKVQELSKSLNKEYMNSFTVPQSTLENIGDTILHLGVKRTGKINAQIKTAEFAALALCPLSVTKKIGTSFYDQTYKNYLYKIISDRKPDWIDAWIEERLKGEWISIDWHTLREFIKNGICSKPTSDGYIRLFVTGLPYSGDIKDKDRYIPLSQQLRDNPDLLQDEVWRLFEVETIAFDYLSSETYKPNENFEGWSTALANLAATGDIDRNRLLDCCINGLSSGFKNNVLSGYIKFHEKLNPSIEEVVVRQQSYLDLLSSRAQHIVTFSLNTLKDIDKHKKLDYDGFINSISSVFTVKSKTQPVTALKIFESILKSNPDLSDRICKITVNGLSHSSHDVQEKCIIFLNKWAKTDNKDLPPAIENYFDDIAPSLKADAIALLSKFGREPDCVIEPAKSSEPTISLEDLHQRINSIDPAIRKLTGLDNPDILLNQQLLPPLQFDMMDVPLLSSLQPLKPIEDLEELIDVVSHLVEIVDSIDDVERILDAISRLCTIKPSDFEKRTDPLVKRISAGGGSNSGRGLVSSWGAPASLLEILHAWLRNKTVKFDYDPDSYYINPVKFIDVRLKQLRDRILKQQSAPLLSMPTHTGGWIDPVVFVDRVLQLQQSKIKVPKYDLMQALLRLTPDNRQEALRYASKIRDIEGDIIRFALNIDKTPSKFHKDHAPLWLVAARSRDPYGKLDFLKPLKIDSICPDGINPAQYSWRFYIDKVEDHFSKKVYDVHKVEINHGTINFPEKDLYDWPTAILHKNFNDKLFFSYTRTAWVTRWISMIWPQNIHPFLAEGCWCLFYRLDQNSSTLEPNFPFIEPLLEPDRPLTDLAYLPLCLGLISKDSDAKGYALDVLAEAIQDGRIHPEPLSNVLVKMGNEGSLKPNRLADSLSEVAKLSPLHTYIVATTLILWLSSQQELPRDSHYLLSLLLDLLTKLGLKLDDKGGDILKAIKGTGKTVKIAKNLLSYNPDRLTTEYHQAMASHLEARVARAERWQAALKGNLLKV